MSEAEQPKSPVAVDRNPRLGVAAFTCPHCRAYTQQRWFGLSAEPLAKPPQGFDLDRVREVIAEQKKKKDSERDAVYPIERLERLVAALQAEQPALERQSQSFYVYWNMDNANLSECFVCKRVALWIGGRLAFPVVNAEVPEPNEDLPDDIRRDYVEAGEVVSASPRAAAALLRLAIEKLCSHLLERDAKINTMIGELVARGLSPLIQKALDVVRVVGNEAVHPGEIDLRDDQPTAMQLFGLVNLIAEQMISQPKHVLALYGTLPADKIAGIEQRDAKAKGAAEQ